MIKDCVGNYVLFGTEKKKKKNTGFEVVRYLDNVLQTEVNSFKMPRYFSSNAKLRLHAFMFDSLSPVIARLKTGDFIRAHLFAKGAHI